MKKEEQVEKAMQHLAIAMNLIPQDTNFGDERRNVKNVLLRLESSMNKRVKRKDIQATVLNQWNEKVKSWTSVDPKKSIEMIDKMIEQEKNKLSQNQKPTGPNQTLLG